MAQEKHPKSVRHIKAAFLALLGEKDFADITVKDIAHQADISRGTFYQHFSDKFELLEAVEQELVDMFVEAISMVHNHEMYCFYEAYRKQTDQKCRLMLYRKGYSALLVNVCGQQPSSILNKVVAQLDEMERSTASKKGQVWAQYKNVSLAALYINIFYRWLGSDADLTDAQYKEASEMFYNLDRLFHSFDF
ncbi:MAG: TetR/AcrR family transcriptional regulator [Ruminococcaceae bacterium]|nr:TetR/AcrR family transcriptional regulator [Oscillospiraceae bacterium]